jgi:2TM domain
MPKGTRSEPQQLRFTEPPLRGFIIHLAIFVVVMCGLAALNLTRNPAHPWFLWVFLAWGIALAVHALVLLVKTRPKKGDTSSAKQASGISKPTPPTLPKHHRAST